MKKRVLSIILAVVMTVSMAAAFSVTASAEQAEILNMSCLTTARLRLQATWAARKRL